MRYTYIAISLLLFGYVLARAIIVPLTVDEAWTYDAFIMRSTVWEVVSYAHPVANNHILNTLLAKLFALISPYEVFLRMPNILSFGLYLYSAYKITNILSHTKWVRLAFFLSLLLNITLIDFFALCRGYGLSIGLMLFCLYQLLLLTQNGWKKHNAHAGFISMVLAVYASFTLLYVFVPVALWMIFIYLRSSNGSPHIKDYIRALTLPAIYTLLLLALCYHPVKQLQVHDELYYGGDLNFIDDTLYTLLQDVVSLSFISHHKRLVLVMLLIPLLTGFVVSIYKGLSKPNLVYTLYPLLLFFCITIINLHFYTSHSKLIISRTALFLYPLIMLSIFSGIGKLEHSHSRLMTFVSLCVVTTLSIFFIKQVNFKPVREWWFNAHDKEVIAFINQHTKHKERKTRLYTYHLCAASQNYYIETRGYNIETIPDKPVIPDEELSYFDFLYLKYYDQPTHALPAHFRLVSTYNEKNFLLYENRNMVHH